MSRARIFEEIAEERSRQDDQWGGPDHDAEHSVGDWLRYIEKQARRVDRRTRASRPRSLSELRTMAARPRLLKIAALAVAAIESIDSAAGSRRRAERTGAE